MVRGKSYTIANAELVWGVTSLDRTAWWEENLQLSSVLSLFRLRKMSPLRGRMQELNLSSPIELGPPKGFSNRQTWGEPESSIWGRIDPHVLELPMFSMFLVSEIAWFRRRLCGFLSA